MRVIRVDGKSLTLGEFRRIVRREERCELDSAARERIVTAHRVILDTLARGEAIYGVNTGFGDLARIRIPDEQMGSLQERLLVSHAAGVGEPLADEAVRGMLLLRANTLARGYSGVRPELVELLLALLDADLLPVVPAKGSVGASGDLAPLSHLALPLIGRGQVRLKGDLLPAAEALQSCGLEPLVLGPKEGLALINGTQAMTSLLALAALAAHDLARIADLIGAMSTDAVRGTDGPFDRRLHELRPHPGQVASAANLWHLLQGSEIRESHREGDSRVQDPYSIRCMPQVHGAARDLLADVEGKLAIEMNAVTDNPLVLADDGEIVSGGNFHGEPMALAADILAMGLAELGSISERRIDKLTDSVFSGLPAFLTEDPGLNSGFMMAQVTAAALASENKGLTHPASVDSIPTSAEKEDHVSMGMGAAVKLQQVVINTRQILAIELLSAAQGIDLLRPLESSDPIEALHKAVRRRVPKWEEDREMAPDLAAAAEFLDSDIRPHIEALR
jgi:histidine ammonia-lyase